MKIVDKVEDFIFEAPVWKLVLVLALITLFRTGVWYIPNLGASIVVAQNPFTNPIPDQQQYLVWNWLGPFAAWLIGANEKWSFFVFHLFFSVAFTLLFIKTVFSTLPNHLARASLVIFCVLPVSATAYFCVSTDSITLFLLLAALVFRTHALVTFVIGAMLGMEHFEQGFFACSGLLFATLLSRKFVNEAAVPLRFCVTLIAGVVSGKLVLFAIFSHYGIEVATRSDWLKNHIEMLLSQFFFHFHYIVWSVVGLGWLVAVKYIELGCKTIPFFAALFFLMLLLPVSADQTRVLANITFPLVIVYWLLNSEFLEAITRKELGALKNQVQYFWEKMLHGKNLQTIEY